MLPPFKVPITLTPAGARFDLLVRDVEACVFWQGFPEPLQETSLRAQRAYDLAEAAWYEQLLIRVTLRPALDLSWGRLLGDDIRGPVEAYLQAVGFIPYTVVEAVDAADLLDLPQDAAAQAARALEAYRAAHPPRWIRTLLKVLGSATGLSPAALWTLPISEFLFSYWCCLDDQAKAAVPLPEFRARRPPPAWMPPGLAP